MTSAPPPFLRTVLVWVAATAATAVGGRLLLGDLRSPDGTVEDALATVCEVALLGCLGWAWVATTAVVGQVVLGRRGAAQLPGVPPAWRRVVLLACGAALTVGVALPAAATPGSVHLDPTGRGSGLDGLPMPERAVDLPVDRASAPVRAAAPGVVVGPGDSLWSIAGAALGAPERWREIYALNRSVIGPDPDLVLPGQHLTLPPA